MAMQVNRSIGAEAEAIRFDRDQPPVINYSRLPVAIADVFSGNLGFIPETTTGLELTCEGLGRRIVDFTVLSAPVFVKLALGDLPLAVASLSFTTRAKIDAIINGWGMIGAKDKAEFFKHAYRVVWSTIKYGKYGSNLWILELALTVAAPALSREVSDRIFGAVDSFIDEKMGSVSSDQIHVSLPITEEQKAKLEAGATFDVVRNADNKLEVKIIDDKSKEVPRAGGARRRAPAIGSRSKLTGVQKSSARKKKPLASSAIASKRQRGR